MINIKINDDISFMRSFDCNRYLYHYTSEITALDYILENGTIRMSPLSVVNDPRESKDKKITIDSNWGNLVTRKQNEVICNEINFFTETIVKCYASLKMT